ncbi:MAG: alpha-1,2-fucosyltransferase [Spirochaetia bacterium]|nr:alpha-1,2-fucosyltransferase [Spirochaetia bacterium]
MILLRLTGGLGNQLFQYAAGRSLADLWKVPLKIDTTSFWNDRLRQYALRPFRIRAEQASFFDRRRFENVFANGIEKRISIFFPHKNGKIWKDPNHGYNPPPQNPEKEIYLDGYWQSWRYFFANEPAIRRDLKLEIPAGGINLRLSEEIRSASSVSIHIRRADYVDDSNAARVHGVCDMSYYKRAVKWIEERVHQPRFYIFSDDPLWVRQNFDLCSDPVVVGHNDGVQAFEDLRLMASCRHHIIANSTFSWWGAWLSNQPGKTVLCPATWFADSAVVPDMKQFMDDLLPSEWVRL